MAFGCLEYTTLIISISFKMERDAMQDLEPTRTQSLIDRYFSEEEERKNRQLSMATLNVMVEAPELAMLTTLAKRFNKTRTELAQDILSQALVDMLARMPAGERKLLARDADEMANNLALEIAEENSIPAPSGKTSIWAGHEKAITKEERRIAKLMEEKQKQAEVQEEAMASTETADTVTADTSSAPAAEESMPTEQAEASSEQSAETSEHTSTEVPFETDSVTSINEDASNDSEESAEMAETSESAVMG